MQIRVKNQEYNLELTIDVTDKTLITLGLLDLSMLTYQHAWRLISGILYNQKVAAAWIFALKCSVRNHLTKRHLDMKDTVDLTEVIDQRLQVTQIELELEQAKDSQHRRPCP